MGRMQVDEKRGGDRPVRGRARASLALALALCGALAASSARADSFVNFESGQVRPLSLTPDGKTLLAVNTPDNRLEILSLHSGLPVPVASVPVGLEPVAVAARSDREAWVVNHLSDSISVVDLASSPPRVVRTLLVGDEPRDIVFAGPGRGRAFVTAAHRGQNRPGDPQFTTPGVGRADVWVFDTADLGAALGGTPLAILNLFGDTPRALASSPDGSSVYAAVFHSGNRTTTVTEGAVCNGGASASPCDVYGSTMPGGLPAPNTNSSFVLGPETGLIVRFDGVSSKWKDQVGRDWSPAVRFSLPDLDVFRIDANAAVPVQVESWASVGTILFDLAVNPKSGRVYATNTEARNEVRFEGPGGFIGSSTVHGHLHEARITVLDGADVLPRRLNKHVDYSVVPSPPGTKQRSLATPVGMAVSSDGERLWVAAFGSSKVGVFSTAEIEGDTVVPDAAAQVAVSGGGPTGLVLDEARGRLYVATRFDDAISTIDTSTRLEIDHRRLHDPEPASVVDGRPFLYDAAATSSNGEASCSSCHVFGDLDSLAWDLGDPWGEVLNNPNPFEFNIGQDPDFHPLKGPMTTQSLRGMAGQGPMHWRGDRTGGNDAGGDALDEKQAFLKFNPAFVGLLGRSSELTSEEMSAFADFILSVRYPPNPNRRLDNGLTAAQQRARSFYFGVVSDAVRTCDGCHVLDPSKGFFGTDGEATFENETQMFKIAHLRNAYTKVGMFGMPRVDFVVPGNNGFRGPQVRGYGFLHDGSIDTIFRFLSASVFNVTVQQKLDLEQFVLAFDSDLAPIVGQQVTRDGSSDATVDARIDLLAARAAAGECDLVARGVAGGEARGWRRLDNGRFRSDRSGEPAVDLDALRVASAGAGGQVTFLCVPPGSGRRIGLDRDEDDALDRDEIDAGSDPADAESRPQDVEPSGIPTRLLAMSDEFLPTMGPLPAPRKVRFAALESGDAAFGAIRVPTPGSVDDPRVGGATVTVYASGPEIGRRDRTSLVLRAADWRLLGTPESPRGYKFVASDPAFPIRMMVLRAGSLRFSGGGPNWNYTLDEASQGRVAVRVAIGASLRLCAEAPAAVAGAPPSPLDGPGSFAGQRKAPAPAVCPSLG